MNTNIELFIHVAFYNTCLENFKSRDESGHSGVKCDTQGNFSSCPYFLPSWTATPAWRYQRGNVIVAAPAWRLEDEDDGYADHCVSSGHYPAMAMACRDRLPAAPIRHRHRNPLPPPLLPRPDCLPPYLPDRLMSPLPSLLFRYLTFLHTFSPPLIPHTVHSSTPLTSRHRNWIGELLQPFRWIPVGFGILWLLGEFCIDDGVDLYVKEHSAIGLLRIVKWSIRGSTF